MSALPQALPLALSAAFYPPALLVLLALLTGEHPRRLVLAYFAGAAILTIVAGLIALMLLTQTGATTQRSSTASGWLYIAVGMLLLALSRWAWRRKAREPTETRDESGASRGRIAGWSQRATTSQKWAFVLGLVMFLPSPLYLLAVKEIADSGDSSSSNVLAVLICAVAVMLFVEIPLVAMFVRPGGVAAGIERFHGWLRRNGWSFAAGLALIAGISAIAQGIDALS
jgi:Sap, sulfolipid-1-addressing protein